MIKNTNRYDNSGNLNQREKAFESIATDEQKILLYLLECSYFKRNATIKSIVKRLSLIEPCSRQKVERLINNLEGKKLVERIKSCPTCRVRYDRIPPICEQCGNRILPADFTYRYKKQWPKYIIRLESHKTRIIEDFISYFIQLEKSIDEYKPSKLSFPT